MALTFTNTKVDKTFGRQLITTDIAFDSSYPFGGETVAPRLLGLETIETIIIQSTQGYTFEFDYTNNKVKVYKPAPAIVREERHVMDTDKQVTLDYPCALILNVASESTHYPVIDYADTIADGEVQYTALPTLGARSTLQFGTTQTDELDTDGDFKDAATNWTEGAGWAWAGDKEPKSGDGTGTLSHDNFAAVIGHTYKLVYTVSGWSVGTVTPTLGGTAGTAVGADGTYTEYITATTNGGLLFTPTNTSRFTLDDITVECQDVYVSYITQAWKEVWDNIVRETQTTATHVASSDYVYLAIESLYGNHATVPVSDFEYIRGGDTPAAGECEIDFTDTGNSNLTTMTFAAADAITGTIVRALKQPSSGFLSKRFTEDEDLTMATGAGNTGTANYPVLFHATCGQIPDFFDANERDAHNLQMNHADALGGTGEFKIVNQTIYTNDETTDAVSLSYVWGEPSDIVGLIPLEVPDGEDLSGITGVRAVFIGI